jgi:hypothetical protein
MPVQGKHFYAAKVFGADPAREGEDCHNDEHDHSYSDVKGVQADE